MEGKRFIQKIKLQNLLSYGSQGEEIELEPLNVLIGPNASGKSNLIEAINLLHYTTIDLGYIIREGGGIREWLWKGQEGNPIASIETVIDSSPQFRIPFRYKLDFTMTKNRFEIVEEILEDAFKEHPENEVNSYYRNQAGKATISFYTNIDNTGNLSSRKQYPIPPLQVKTDQSAFLNYANPVTDPEIKFLNDEFSKIRVYRDWNVGRESKIRQLHLADSPGNFLLEDASNLALVLHNLQERPEIYKEIVRRLQEFNPKIEDYRVEINGGYALLLVKEKGLSDPTPSVRLSDGTLRYLCLLAVLCHPEPPPLICIEESEMGLHPDILSEVAELLLEASKRTQLIVTTHSDVLISGLSEAPEAVLVCERDEDGSHLRRLEPARLKEWLEKYMLGDLWLMGEIGGTRW